METFGERLRRLREGAGYKANQFARMIGRDPSFITRVEKGTRRADDLPAIRDLKKIAAVFSMTVEQLTEGLAQPDAPASDRVLESVTDVAIEVHEPLPYEELLRRMGAMPDVAENSPLFDDLIGHGGRGGSFPGDIADALPTWMDKRTIEDLENRFRLRIHGTCMEPDINDHDVLIFDKRRMIEPGRIVAALVNMEETVIRKLVMKDGYLLLVANKNHDPIPVDWRVQIAAAAVGGQYELL